MFRSKSKDNSVSLSRAAEAEAAAFPPMGTTLSAYSPAGYTSPAPKAAVSPKHRKGARQWLKRMLITILIVVLLAGGFLTAKLVINTAKSFDGNLFGLLRNDKLDGEDVGRVNILLAGNSADDPGHGGGMLTDSIMIVSIDTRNNTAFLMSIPRDLWVSVPNNGYAKINTVYQYGEEEGFVGADYPDGGMGSLMKLLERDLAIDLNYYALINYAAFRDAVNAVGGIDVTIDSDDPRGLYDANISKADGGPLKLANGLQTLDGQTALNLARARGSGYSYGFPLSDFNRSENQRLMLVALAEKASSSGVLANPVKVSNLLDSFGKNVVTDFKTSEVRRLKELTGKIPASSVKSVGLNEADGESLLMSYRGTGGQSALAPKAGVDDYSDIQAFLEKLMAPPPAATRE